MKAHNDPFIVYHISFDTTKLVDHNKQFHEKIRTSDAQRMAREAGRDLVCFNRPQGTEPAFCKILDFNKWKYESEKKQRKEERQNRKQCKEIRFSPAIADNDIEHKVRQVLEFLADGDDVIMTMKLRGREKCHFDMAEEKMNKIVSLCNGHGKEVSRKKTKDLIIIRMVKGSTIQTNNKKEENADEKVIQ